MTRNQVVTFVALAGFAILGYRNPALPSPAPVTAPLDSFSSERALVHINAIAQHPHPAGENESVRAYIADQVTKLGLTPVEQSGTGLRVNRGNIYAARVTNVMTRISGTANTKAVLLLGHYDSVANGPGAADDGHAVGVLLETLRALKTASPSHNDVIALFTDGEEADLLGAEAFVADNPWVRDVGVVVNFEARGTKGVPVMFETSDENGWLIREFRKAAPHPYANSLTYEIYKRLPNDTDLTVFKRHGLAGLNFAFIENFLFYHSPNDDPAHLDPSSLQQQGEYALSLARHFGNVDLRQVRATNLVYFNVPMLGMFAYSVNFVWPLTVLAILAVVIAIIIAFRAKTLTTSQLFIGLAMFPVIAMTSALLSTGIWIATARLHPAYTTFLQGDVYNHVWYIAGFESLALALVSGVLLWRYRRSDSAGFAAGVLIWIAIATVAASALVPGATYLLTWPLLFGAIALAIFSAREISLPRLIAMLLCSAVTVLLLVPLIPQFFTALGMGAIDPTLIVSVILLGLLATPLAMLCQSRWLPLSALAACIVCIAGANMTSRFDVDHPRQNSVFYALDGDNGKAIWASSDAVTDPWTSQFLGSTPRRGANDAFAPKSPRTLFQNDAPALKLDAPTLSISNENTSRGMRTIQTVIASPRHANVLMVFVSSDTPVLSGETDGKSWTRPATASRDFFIRFEALPPNGVAMSFTLPAGYPLNLRIVDQAMGLPAIPGFSIHPREPWMIRGWSYPYGESTVVSKAFKL